MVILFLVFQCLKCNGINEHKLSIRILFSLFLLSSFVKFIATPLKQILVCIGKSICIYLRTFTFGSFYFSFAAAMTILFLYCSILYSLLIFDYKDNYIFSSRLLSFVMLKRLRLLHNNFNFSRFIIFTNKLFLFVYRRALPKGKLNIVTILVVTVLSAARKNATSFFSKSSEYLKLFPYFGLSYP